MSKNKLMFIIDLDRTTLTKDWSIPQNNIDAIDKAKEQGHIVCIVTGRPTAGAIMFYQQLGLETLMGVLNGNGLYRPNNKGNAKIAKMSSAPLIDFISQEETKDIPVDFAYQVDSQIHSTHNTTEIMSKWYHNRLWKILDTKTDVPDLIECGFIMIEEHHTQDLENYFEKYEESIAMHKWEELKGDGFQIYEFFNAGYTKGTIVQEIMNEYSMDIENVHVFGDGTNDISMFEKTKNTYAVANAHPDLKSVAMEVLPYSNEEGAVGIKIEEILSQNK